MAAIASYQSITHLRERVRLVEHTQQVQLQIEELLAAFSEARVVWRDFLANGAGDIANFEAAAQSIPGKIGSLQSLTGDNLPQQARLTQISSVVNRDLAAMRDNIGRTASGALSDPADILRTLNGNQLNIAEVTGLAMQMKSEEESLLLTGGPQVERQASETVTFIVVGSILSLFMLIGAFGLLRRDVAERRSAEKKLQDSNVFLDSVLENIPNMIFIKEAGSLRYVGLNKAGERLLGYSRKEMIGKNDSDFFPANEADQFLARDREVLAGGEMVDIAEEEIHTKDGALRVLHTRKIPLRDEKGVVRNLVGVSEDITIHKQAQEALRRSEERFRLIVEGAVDYAIFMLDPNGLIVSWNAGAQRIKGYQAAEIIGRHFRLFYPREVAERGYPEQELAIAAAQGRFEDEGWRVRKDGSTFWANVVITALRDEHGALSGFSKISRDLTERKQQQERLQQSEERLRLLIEGVSDYGIVMLDPEGRVSSWNTGAQRIQGYTAEEVIGQSFSLFFTEDDLAAGRPKRELEEARSKGRVADEGWRVRKDGSRFWAQIVITALHDPQGAVRGFAKVIRDATVHKRVEALEEEGRQTHEFLAMLAHELRNPLAPIRNAANLLHSASIGAEQLAWCRDIIDRQVTHLARLVDDLLDISRITTGKIKLERTPVDINVIVAQAIESTRAAFAAKQQTLKVNLDPGAIRVEGDITRLSQVIVNLLNNATKYTPKGGLIEVNSAREGEYAVIKVRDSGIGIPAHLLDKVFDLFIQGDRTLDRSEGGLGIGLTLVRRIVTMHGGRVEAASAGPGKGSEFTLWLPVLAEAEPAVNTTKQDLPDQKSGKARRVLVVDDNHDSAESLAMLLRLLGHEVNTAHDGPSALSSAMRHRPEIVLMDIGLPGMSGYDVAREIRASPDLNAIRLIAITGYGQEGDRRQALDAGFDDHCVKPVEVAKLAELMT
jgi:PAS domain S-box-containing protein